MFNFSLPSQIFEFSDIYTILFLVVLEALLSADNALVLATVAKKLPKKLQQKALTYGIIGALIFRFIAILFASVIIEFWWLQAIGAAYLLFLPIKHFFLYKSGSHTGTDSSKKSFWKAVLEIELIDIAFAIDSVLAGVALISSSSKLWVVYAGAVIGIIILRLAANKLIKVMDKYPGVEDLAYILVAWVGCKLAFSSANLWSRQQCNIYIPEMDHTIFWIGSITILVGGLYYIRKKSS